MEKNLPAMQETWVRSLGWKESPGEGHGNPVQYSCLENPMDRGAWWPTVHGVAKGQTGLSTERTHIHTGIWAPERAEEPRPLLMDHVHEPGLMEHGLGVLGLEEGPLSR